MSPQVLLRKADKPVSATAKESAIELFRDIECFRHGCKDYDFRLSGLNPFRKLPSIDSKCFPAQIAGNAPKCTRLAVEAGVANENGHQSGILRPGIHRSIRSTSAGDNPTMDGLGPGQDP